jgi:hypothetical protein
MAMLSFRIAGGHVPVARLLLEHGCDTALSNDMGRTGAGSLGHSVATAITGTAPCASTACMRRRAAGTTCPTLLNDGCRARAEMAAGWELASQLRRSQVLKLRALQTAAPASAGAAAAAPTAAAAAPGVGGLRESQDLKRRLRAMGLSTKVTCCSSVQWLRTPAYRSGMDLTVSSLYPHLGMRQ